jgi:hypothetical protein
MKIGRLLGGVSSYRILMVGLDAAGNKIFPIQIKILKEKHQFW